MLGHKKLPEYIKIATDLQEKIQKGELTPGEKLPSERSLAKDYKVSSIVVNKAINLLDEEGFITKIARKGNYVSENIQERKQKTPEKDKIAGNEFLQYDFELHEDLLTAPGTLISRKKIRVGILQEYKVFPKIWKRILYDYQKENPHIEIEPVHIGTLHELVEKAATPFVDMIQIPANILPYFVNQELLFDISDMSGDLLHEKDFYPGLLRGCRSNKKLWGAPLKAGTNCLFYKKQKKINNLYSVNFWKFMEKLEAFSQKPENTFNAMIYSGFNLFVHLLTCGYAPEKSYDQLMTFKNPGIKEFLERFKPYLENSKVFHSNIRQNHHYKVMTEMNIPFIFGSSSWVGRVLNIKTIENLEIRPVPKANNGYSEGNTYICCASRFTRFPEEVVDFIKYLGSFETQRKFAENGHIMSSRKANLFLRMFGINVISIEELNEALMSTEVIAAENPYIYDYISAVLNFEVERWRTKQLSTEQLLEVLKRKTAYYNNPHTGMQKRESA